MSVSVTHWSLFSSEEEDEGKARVWVPDARLGKHWTVICRVRGATSLVIRETDWLMMALSRGRWPFVLSGGKCQKQAIQSESDAQRDARRRPHFRIDETRASTVIEAVAGGRRKAGQLPAGLSRRIKTVTAQMAARDGAMPKRVADPRSIQWQGESSWLMESGLFC